MQKKFSKKNTILDPKIEKIEDKNKNKGYDIQVSAVIEERQQKEENEMAKLDVQKKSMNSNNNNNSYSMLKDNFDDFVVFEEKKNEKKIEKKWFIDNDFKPNFKAILGNLMNFRDKQFNKLAKLEWRRSGQIDTKKKVKIQEKFEHCISNS